MYPTTTSTTTLPSPKGNRNSLTVGEILGVVIGILAVVIGVITMVYQRKQVKLALIQLMNTITIPR